MYWLNFDHLRAHSLANDHISLLSVSHIQLQSVSLGDMLNVISPVVLVCLSSGKRYRHNFFCTW